MDYTPEMNLQSASGYCMPFEETSGDVKMILGYGKQRHPDSNEEFFHHGVDFETNRYVLAAVADGIVNGIGSNDELGLHQTIRYGKYDVTYGRLTNALVPFGTRVKAGSVVAISGDRLHLEVRYDGEEINPIPFLTMIYGNMKMGINSATGELPQMETVETDIPTDYEDDSREIEQLMLRFYSQYLSDVAAGLYHVPEHTEQSLRNIFSVSAVKNYFYEMIPSFSNPLGIGERSIPVAVKVQNLLIGDFLNYLVLRHGIFLSSMSESDKKKRSPRHSHQRYRGSVGGTGHRHPEFRHSKARYGLSRPCGDTVVDQSMVQQQGGRGSCRGDYTTDCCEVHPEPDRQGHDA